MTSKPIVFLKNHEDIMLSIFPDDLTEEDEIYDLHALYSLEELNSVSYQEPYGRQSMYSILSNNIKDNLEQESILSTDTSDQPQH